MCYYSCHHTIKFLKMYQLTQTYNTCPLELRQQYFEAAFNKVDIKSITTTQQYYCLVYYYGLEGYYPRPTIEIAKDLKKNNHSSVLTSLGQACKKLDNVRRDSILSKFLPPTKKSVSRNRFNIPANTRLLYAKEYIGDNLESLLEDVNITTRRLNLYKQYIEGKDLQEIALDFKVNHLKILYKEIKAVESELLKVKRSYILNELIHNWEIETLQKCPNCHSDNVNSDGTNLQCHSCGYAQGNTKELQNIDPIYSVATWAG